MSTIQYLLLTVIALVVIIFSTLPFWDCNDKVEMTESCIFCDIIAGKKPETNIVKETSEFVIFEDIRPTSKYHFLAVTKRHIESVKVLTKNDIDMIRRMETGLKQYYTSRGIDNNDAIFGFHQPPAISVKHLHMHGIAPKSTMSFINRLVFKSGTFWFKTVEEQIRAINEKA
ncbi:histidine triad nucleotide-binding protein 3-like [Teleopsis dalmanni]|uniref:histidine triad nucleotide-binding protein 3-like n=1 Tax=Teleopsis dalmanni TaxID=139649 RepID=UPI0018CF5C34|nr:histidine triad nucleotide-binding protein 3-like [Teleopsis dalmanni]